MWWNKKVGRKREQGRLIPLRFGTVIRWLPFVPGLVALGRGSSAARSQQERKLHPAFKPPMNFCGLSLRSDNLSSGCARPLSPSERTLSNSPLETRGANANAENNL